VDEVLKVIEQTPPEARVSTGLARLLNNATTTTAVPLADALQPSSACMVCALWADTEREYVSTFGRFAGDPQLQQVYADSDGFCLPHFRLVLRQSYPPETLKRVVELQSAIWTRLRADLELFLDRHQHERMHETMGSESDSWQRVIGQMAGEQGVFGVGKRAGK
jgi:hypothetical protein